MKFNYGKTFLLGFGFLGISIVWPIFNQFIPWNINTYILKVMFFCPPHLNKTHV